MCTRDNNGVIANTVKKKTVIKLTELGVDINCQANCAQLRKAIPSVIYG